MMTTAEREILTAQATKAIKQAQETNGVAGYIVTNDDIATAEAALKASGTWKTFHYSQWRAEFGKLFGKIA